MRIREPIGELGRRRVFRAATVYVASAWVAVAAGLFAWQQWFAVTGRIALEVGRIEATDSRDDTQLLADHLAARFRLLLGGDAATAGPARRLTGTLGRGEGRLRLTLELLEPSGETAWAETFNARLVDQSRLQEDVLRALWPQLGWAGGELRQAVGFVASCAYPPDEDALLAMVLLQDPGALSAFVDGPDSGLLFMAQARGWFAEMLAAAPSRKPVLQRMALQSLDNAQRACPDYPEIPRLRAAVQRAAAR